jgi:hypothetical protein
VAIELKRGRPTDQVVGQLARYMGWPRQHLAEPGQAVDGIIVAHDIDPKLQYATAALPGATVMAYDIAFRLIDASLAPTTAPTTNPAPWPPAAHQHLTHSIPSRHVQVGSIDSITSNDMPICVRGW